ncbi:redoxin domain-containing protein [Caballeronia sp. GAFFF1]|uniref:redoxin domain-containing protein n=1 Tax=Caballeronia sp. GAFFF1 TaxID=2921779 RepID=UPI0020288048|nr:redoxin domain-containing protein [Caballeronia sp. GAFFF1]
MGHDLEILQADADADADAAAELAMTAASNAVTRALHAGAQAPSFVLPDKQGNKVALDHLLSSAPVVIHFLRGSWCTFGEESLAHFAAMHAHIALTGAKAVAIAPPDASPREASRLPVTELVDRNLRTTRAFGLTFDLPEALRSRYLDLGYTPPKLGESDRFLVPVPATYLINEAGVVVFAHVDFDYRNALDGELLIRVLHKLHTRRNTQSGVD